MEERGLGGFRVIRFLGAGEKNERRKELLAKRKVDANDVGRGRFISSLVRLSTIWILGLRIKFITLNECSLNSHNFTKDEEPLLN